LNLKSATINHEPTNQRSTS